MATMTTVATGQERLTLLGHTKPVQGLAFSPDGKKLVSCGIYDGGGEVLLWEGE